MTNTTINRSSFVRATSTALRGPARCLRNPIQSLLFATVKDSTVEAEGDEQRRRRNDHVHTNSPFFLSYLPYSTTQVVTPARDRLIFTPMNLKLACTAHRRKRHTWMSYQRQWGLRTFMVMRTAGIGVKVTEYMRDNQSTWACYLPPRSRS